MIDANYRKYKTYNEFINDFLITVMENGHAVIMVNYKDYQGVISSLNGKTLNGKTLAMDCDTLDLFDEDITTAMKNDGNMMITVYNSSSKITGEPVIYPDKFFESAYFVEEDAVTKAMDYVMPSRIVPFKIEKKTITV